MAAATAFDVWLLAANTVYKGVPFGVVTDWAQQGRLSPDDNLRPAGSGVAWVRAADHPTVADYLFVRKRGGPAALPMRALEELEPVTMDVGFGGHADHDDADPDMIPLIDISLVLLIFFMMTSAVAALSPIKVPEMKNAGELSADPQAFTVVIDKRANGDVQWSIRQGTKAVEGATDLESMASLVARLEELLNREQAEGKPPPEVRIACHRDLPSDHVHDVAKDLQRLKDAKKLSSYGAEVSEKK